MILSGLLSELLDQLHTPAVRDLAWVIGSPVLLDAEHPRYAGQVVSDTWCQHELARHADWLLTLDFAPAPLLQHIEQQATRRLGYYFETLVEFWLSNTADIHLHAHNLPVKDHLRTLGEFDFLFRSNNTLVHWETAIKFYLKAEPGLHQHDFVGPGGYDRLDLKVDRIFNHQLKLAQSSAHRENIDHSQAYVKGMLFYPAGSQTPAPEGVSAQHLRGWWLPYGKANLPQTSPLNRWLILPRLSWLAPARLPGNTEVSTAETMHQKLELHFQQRKIAVLLAELAQHATGEWHEVSRGFVASSDWPAIDEETN